METPGTASQPTGQTFPEDTYIVTGSIRSTESAGVGGLLVRLVDKNVGPDVELGVATTDAHGNYRITASLSPDGLQQRLKTRPDLQARVFAGSEFVGASVVRYSASRVETLDVALPAGLTALPSEYEGLSASLGRVYTGPLAELEEGAERQDITYLANKTGWDARAVALVVLADQFAQLTAPLQAPTPSTAAGPTAGAAPAAMSAGTSASAAVSATSDGARGLKPEFYYALFRAGIPAHADGVFATSPKTVQAIWEQAIKKGIIPRGLANDLTSAVASFQALSAAHILSVKPPVGISTLREMLQASLSDAGQQRQFAQAYVQYSDDLTAFWSTLQTSLGEETTKELQLNGQLFYLTLNNEPLVRTLHAAEQQNPLSSTLDLATRGYHDASKWMPLINGSIPAHIPGDNADEKRHNYASLLAAKVRIAFPTAVVADLVRRGTFKLSDQSIEPAAVADFLMAHQGKFALGVEPVEAYVARTRLTGTPASVITEIKRLQRVYQLTPDDQSMAVLLQHGLDSAHAITRYDSSAFERAFQSKLGSADTASAIHARAKQIHSAVLNIVVSYLGARIAPPLGGKSPIHIPFSSPSADERSSVIAYPTLESLFGSLDYCNCPECRSILSPAAYLVDLLNYLDTSSPTPGYQNPQDVLFQRRPDLQYLPLTCENTNTALPYIDIANETLEYFVANNLSLANYQGRSTDDTVTSDELMASPQYVNDAAYTTLQNAFFPPPLPFNRSLELLRLHMRKLGVRMSDVMARLRIDDRIDRASLTDATDYGWRDILMEQLSISREEYRLFTDSSIGLAALYGYNGDPNNTLTMLQLTSLQAFSRRTGVSYDDIVSIVKTQFINPAATLIPRLERLNVTFLTLQQLKTGHLDEGTFESQLPNDLDARKYGGTRPDDLHAVFNWVTNDANYARIMSIITITDPSNGPDQCSGSVLQFRYSDPDPDPKANLLRATDFFKLIRFIRLWRKLGLSINQTDQVITALYPPEDLPISGGDETANMSLLDAGFRMLLPRVGFLFQVMEELGLTAVADLAPLLACWSDIGTVGDGSLYHRMFLSHTVEEASAQIAAIAGSILPGDILTTTINGISIPEGGYIVQTGDTVATTATKIASAINRTEDTDPDSGLPLNRRIFASAEGGVNTIKAGFTLDCAANAGATETYATEPQSDIQPPLSYAARIGLTAAAAKPTPGDVLTTTINGVLISYTVGAEDTTPEAIATGIVLAINDTTTADPYSGLPLNTLVVASNQGNVITFETAGAGDPLSLVCSLKPATTGTYLADYSFSWTATVSAHADFRGTTLVTTFGFRGNNIEVPYLTRESSPSLAAAAIAVLINTTSERDPLSGLPLNQIVSATRAGSVVTITVSARVYDWDDVSIDCRVEDGEDTVTYRAQGPLLSTPTAIVAGNMPAGTILITTIDTIAIPYTVASGDDETTIASNIAAAINATHTPDPNSGLPLNDAISASANGGVIQITFVLTPISRLTCSLSRPPGTYTAGTLPSPFADDGYGNFLQDQSQKLFGHEPTLRAAFNLTGAEFTEIAAALDTPITAQTPLTLDNISAIFRRGWLARKLQLSIVEFLRLHQFTGLDPFAALDPEATPPAEPPMIRFINLLQALAATGIQPVQALYLIWNQDVTGKAAPTIGEVTGFARTLRADFAAIEAQFTLKDDPDGTIAKSLMALVYGSAATDYFFGLLNNTLATSVGYSNPEPTLPQAIIAASNGRLSYDDLRKRLIYTGVLDSATQSAIDQAIANNGNYAPLHIALDNLATANQKTVGPFFATYKELPPLYTAYATSPDPPQEKRTALLAAFLPILKQKRKQEQALAAMTAAVGTDQPFATALLQNPTVLHAAAEQAAPAVTDLTAIEAQGLSARFFLSNDLADTPEIQINADAALSYAPCVVGRSQTVAVGGKITTRDVLITTINGLQIPYTVGQADTSISVLADNIASTINATTALDPYSGLPLKSVISASATGDRLTIGTTNSKGSLTLVCTAVLQTTATYTAGPQVPASQTITVGGTVSSGDVLTTTINGVPIPYTVGATDTTPTTIASRIAGAINATVMQDPAGLPLNRVVIASSAAAVITVTAIVFGPAFTLTCSVSPGATETLTAGVQIPASHTATLAGVPRPGGVLITTVNGVAIPYTVAADEPEATVAGHIAEAINLTTTLVDGHQLNSLVSAASQGGVITIAALALGTPFTLACSLSSYAVGDLVPVVQTAIVAGGITPRDVLTTTINGIPIEYTVSADDATVDILTSNIVKAIQGTGTPDPGTGKPIGEVFSASSTGGVISIASKLPGTRFALVCSTSRRNATETDASETYVSGPQFLANQAIITGGFSPGDNLITTVNGIAIPYVVEDGDLSAATLANKIATAINGTTTPDPVTGVPLKDIVVASGADDGIVTIRAAGSAFTLSCSVSSHATETYAITGGLPANAGVPLAGKWSGYFDVPQDGFYDITIATDVNSEVALWIGDKPVSLTATQNRSIWRNQSPIMLAAGTLTPISLTATSISSSLSVSWESLGLGRTVIPGEYLYSETLIDNLRTTYVRFLAAASLATALSLTAKELAYLGAATAFPVNTADNVDNVAAGNDVTFTPGFMSNIGVGSKLVIDTGAAREVVIVKRITPTTFQADTVNPHNGTATPFPIVGQAFPNIGAEGWLNLLGLSLDPLKASDLTIAEALRDVLAAMLNFARLKGSLSSKDERLLAVLQDPAANDGSALQDLTGWARSSLSVLLLRFFGNIQLANLSFIDNFGRVYDAFAIARSCRISTAALIAVATNAPSARTVSALQATLRALYAESDWIALVRPINDVMRVQQRDALVAYILQRFSDIYEGSLTRAVINTDTDTPAGANVLTLAKVDGPPIANGMQVQGPNIAVYTTVVGVQDSNTVVISPGTVATVPKGSDLTFVPADAVQIGTADKLFEYFLIDVEMQPPVETSRIRLALSSVQLFIERILRNLEPQVSPRDIDSSRWAWMKRYRVWQANREIFLWPENWLYPELRDDKSPFFDDMMSALLQSDITDDAAAGAYLDYLTKLEQVAKLEPCGLYCDNDATSYVVARTAGAHRKHYFRQQQRGGSWTPWSEVQIDCEDMPLTPLMWNGRLLLFWLKVLKQGPPEAINLGTGHIADMPLDTLQSSAANAISGNQHIDVHSVLCWSEYYNGKWQPTKTSDINRPTYLTTLEPTVFDANRNLWAIGGARNVIGLPNDALPLSIYNMSDAGGIYFGFVLYNTHSLPVRVEDAGVSSGPAPAGMRARAMDPPVESYTGGNLEDTETLSITYETYDGSFWNANYPPNAILGFKQVSRYIVPSVSTYDPRVWETPFFFEDRRYLFYITTKLPVLTMPSFTGFGLTSMRPSLKQSMVKFFPLLPRQPLELVVRRGALLPIFIGAVGAAPQIELSDLTLAIRVNKST